MRRVHLWAVAPRPRGQTNGASPVERYQRARIERLHVYIFTGVVTAGRSNEAVAVFRVPTGRRTHLGIITSVTLALRYGHPSA